MSVALNPDAVPFIPPGFAPPRKKSGGERKNHGGGGGQKAQAPKHTYPPIDAVNVTGLMYSPTGARYGPVAQAYLARADYSPTGALYSPCARNVHRLQTELTPSRRETIIKQMEFYFGDSNFPKDKYLQKEGKKRDDGFIPIKVVTGFNKIKKLMTAWQITTPWRLVAKAIECSAVVELNAAKNSVRRRHPLPDPKMNPTWNRTVVVENLARSASIDDVRAQFSRAGKVEHVRMLAGKKRPDDIEAYMSAIKNPHDALRRGRPCTLVEFATADEAAASCAMLTDASNWRSGLRVTMLLPKKPKLKGQSADQPAESPADAPTEGGDDPAAPTAADRRTRRLEKLYAEHPELATVGKGRKAKARAATSAVLPAGVIRLPTRPDGTRGFTGAGRGKPIAT